MTAENRTKSNIKSLKFEEISGISANSESGLVEFLESSRVQPYLRLAGQILRGNEVKSILEEISTIPLEERYVWRVLGFLKHAFLDLDEVSAFADMSTLSTKDAKRVEEQLKYRPLQMCIFMTGLLGMEKMEKTMHEAIETAKQCHTLPRNP